MVVAIIWIVLFIAIVVAIHLVFGERDSSELHAVLFLAGAAIVIAVTAGLALRYYVLH